MIRPPELPGMGLSGPPGHGGMLDRPTSLLRSTRFPGHAWGPTADPDPDGDTVREPQSGSIGAFARRAKQG